MKQVTGVLLIAALIALLFASYVFVYGWAAALFAWGVALAFCGLLVLGCWLAFS